MIQDLIKDKIKSKYFLLSISKPYSGKVVIAAYMTFTIGNCFSNFLMIDDSRRVHGTKSKQGQIRSNCFLLSISKLYSGEAVTAYNNFYN